MTQCASRICFEQARAELLKIGSMAPELQMYQDEPAQMISAAVGKCGYLRLGFTEQDGRSVLSDLDRRVPFLVQKALYWDEGMPDMPCVFIITPTGCVLQGDRLALEIRVGPYATAHVTTQCATKVHMMNANYAAQLQDIVVEEGGYLEFMPDALIPHRTSRFLSDTRLSIAASASVLYSEMLLPGRKYHHKDELFGFDLYSSLIRATRRETGKTLFVEKFVVEPHTMDLMQTGIMNGFEVFGNVILLTSAEYALQVRDAIGADVSLQEGLAYGATVLPHECGLVFKVLGMTSEGVRAKVREFWKVSRKVIRGQDLPDEFLWR